eukprot:Em0015g865a
MTSTVSAARVQEDDTESTGSFKDDPNYLSFRYHRDLLDSSWGSYLHSSAGDRNPVPPRKVVINVPEEAGSQQVSRALSDNKMPKGILRTTETKEEHPPGKQEIEEPRPLTKELSALEAALKTALDDSGALGMEEAVSGMLSDARELLVKAREDRRRSAREDAEDSGIPRSALQVVAACLERLVNGMVESYKRMKTQEDKLESLEEELCRKQVQFLKEQEEMERSEKSKLAAGTVASQSQPRPHASAPVPKVPLLPGNLPKVHAIPSVSTRTVPYTTTHGISQLKPLIKPRQKMDTLIKTHTEQRRLERALFGQQKEIDNLDRSHAQTKRDLMAAQQQIAKLQKQLKDVSTGGNKTANVMNPFKDTKEAKQSDLETDEKLKYKDQKKKMLGVQQQELRNPTLPALHNPPSSQFKMQQKPTQSLVLPTISQHHQVSNDPPHYSFTTDELFSLASFDDPVTAGQVIHWLKKQGRLKDQAHA